MALVRVLLVGYVGNVCVARIILTTLENAFLAQRYIDDLEHSPDPSITALQLAIDKALGFSAIHYFYIREQV